MSSMTVQQRQEDQPWRMPNGDPATWIHLEDIPTPPEVVKFTADICRKCGFWWKREKDEVLREQKLLFLFPGKQIAYKETRRGMLLLMVSEPYSDEIQAFRAALSPKEVDEVQIDYIFNGTENFFHIWDAE